jgi:hypothetical protein
VQILELRRAPARMRFSAVRVEIRQAHECLRAIRAWDSATSTLRHIRPYRLENEAPRIQIRGARRHY